MWRAIPQVASVRLDVDARRRDRLDAAASTSSVSETVDVLPAVSARALSW